MADSIDELQYTCTPSNVANTLSTSTTCGTDGRKDASTNCLEVVAMATTTSMCKSGRWDHPVRWLG
ncbi:hypothetical protein BWQ96_10903 [Gracilariopsis chorda]|uniref:Uncharacterized protein n=1 Tax=Gracilariopsis chorda TaxID=448386 RepID=A0A2V3IBB5_9FLOR|nr:hypothetical protein BWQ96_10903 [Gracilariopsis chorda]|eukprot:PXF39412.1 hypothetical protein BWQ96_10903 [Gracilariopsis chorda]